MLKHYRKYFERAMPTRSCWFGLTAMLLASSVVMAHKGESHPGTGDVSKSEPSTSVVKRVKKKGSVWGRNYFPNPTLITQDGERVKFFDDLIKDKVVAINFIYTTCEDSCPLETARLRKVREILGDRVGKDIFFYSITTTPKIDTPSVLKSYMKKYNIGPGWTFLTGDEQDIIALRKKLGLYIEEIQNDPDNPNDHNLSLIIGNQSSGRWMKRSPFENPYVLSTELADWLHNWKRKPKQLDSYANAPQLRQIDAGETLFRTRCSACHEIGKDGVGPDLLGVVKRRDRGWLERWLKEPDKMLAEKDALALQLLNKYKLPMPNSRLTDKDVQALILFMEEEDKRLSNL